MWEWQPNHHTNKTNESIFFHSGALLDIDSGSSYVSSRLEDFMHKKQTRIEHRNIETMVSTTTRLRYLISKEQVQLRILVSK